MRRGSPGLAAGLALWAAGAGGGTPPPAAQPHPYGARPRIAVVTDIANEPDDQMSVVRFLR